MNDARELFSRLCGIDVADVAVPHRLLRLRAEERDAQVVDQAASQLLARLRAATHQIPAPHLEWMTQQVTNARNFMVAQCVQAQPPQPSASYRQPPVPPPGVAYPWQSHQPPPAEPPVVVRTAVPRRRSGFDAENVMGIVGILVMLAAAGIGAKLFHDQWWKDIMPPPAPKTQPEIRPKPIPPTPAPVVNNGKGRVSPPSPEPEPPPRPSIKPKGGLAAARVQVKAALENVRKGFFDEADLDAQKALMAAPGCDEAQAMRIAIGYVRQYSPLADQAMAALNQNSVVDLGPKHGKGAFITRNDADGSIKFQVKGRGKWFTIDELASISGLRFRVTRDFLDNAVNPANDLILGSYQLVSKLDGDGDVDPKGAIEAARKRWRKAAESGDEQSVEQAGLLQKLLAMDQSD
ncbi:MAG: hypothetical protein HQ464_08515 [Planctomycetes bacterium]|nr:hypothetical protein [Planctomycetota bacterium]